MHKQLTGGYEFDGKEISALSPADVSTAADLIIERGAAAVVVCGVHAPVNPAQELDFAAKLTEELKQRDPGGMCRPKRAYLLCCM